MAAHFHPLRVAEVRRETPQAVSIRLDVPAELAHAFTFAPGQYVNLRAFIDGQDVRRSYSVCSGLDDGELRVAVKHLDGGAFSTYANLALKAGDLIDAMPPQGRFVLPPNAAHSRRYCAFAAGSGITPVLSLIKTVLARKPASQFTLVYGNRSVNETMFLDAIEDIKDQYLTRFTFHALFSREHQELDLFSGRLDEAKCGQFLDSLVRPAAVDTYLICGPEGMIDSCERALHARGVKPEAILIERFGAPALREAPTEPAAITMTGADVTVLIDGKRIAFRMPSDNDQSILEAAAAAGADVPYACKAGVCCTCRARVIEGEVQMRRNFTLEAEEIAQGFRLTCQSRPVTAKVVLSYDER